MSRNVKESDDEWETRGGRRTRTMPGSSSVLDSPLRRSTRIKQPAAQNDSSPESNGDVVAVGVAKNTRRRTIGLDGAIPEITRSLRVRRNSAASDASEVAESDSQAESVGKRLTRRSIACLPLAETPSKMRAKAGRVTRAGSESKSTPPVGRITRRTRASSMEVEMTDQTRIREVETPIKSRKRASLLPSQPEVAEELEDSRLEDTVVEHEAETSSRSFESSRRRSMANASEADEKMEVDEAPVVESEIDTTSQRSFHEITEEEASVASVPTEREDLMEISESPRNDAHRDEKSPQRRIVPNSEKASVTIENLSRKSLEIDETSASNKENEASNASLHSQVKNASQTHAETITSPRKLLDSSFSKDPEKRGSISLIEGPSEDRRESRELVKTAQIVASEIQTKKDYSLEAKCVVLIETMDVEKLAISKTDTPKIPPTQQTPNIVEEDKDSELIVEIENTVDTEKQVSTTAISILAEATPGETENPIIEEEKCDDLEIIEIAKPNELADSSESTEKVPIEEGINEAKPPPNLSNVESIILESTMDQEKLENSQGSEETVIRDETTTIPPIQVDPPSPRNKDPIESEEREAVSRETTISAIGTTIPEATEVEVTSSKPEEETNCASLDAKATSCIASMDGKGPRITEDNRDKIICENLKDRKSSIVAESPSSGTNAEECSRLIEEVTDKSLSDEISTKRSKEHRDRGDKSEEEKSEIFAESDYPKPHYETDDESETAVWASFKEVPASEWISLEKKGDPNNSKEISKKCRNDEDNEEDVDDAADSIHSYSTERNESECEIALVDKDAWQTTKITQKNRDSGDYDSDDTVIASNEKKTTDDAGERMIDEEPNNEETPMDVSSSRPETDEPKKSNFSEVSPKKRCSLNNSKFRDESEHSLEEREKDSPLVSIRGSPSNLDNEPSDASINPEVNSSRRSIVKSPKRRNSSATQQSYDSGENENNQTPKTPVRGSRKSLDANESEKRKSLNMSASKHEEETFDKENSDGDVAEIYSHDSNSADVSRKGSQKFGRKSSKTPNTSKIDTENSDFEEKTRSPEKFDRSLKSESKPKNNTSKIDPENSDFEEKTRSPEKFDRSLKSENKPKNDDDVAPQESSESSASRSKRRSLKNKNESKNCHEYSDEENEEDSRSKLSVSLKSEKRRKSGNSKNNTRLHGESSEDEADNSQPKLRGLSSSQSDRMAKSDKDRSIEATINSDSDGSRESEDEDTTIQKIPRFLFDVNTSSDDDNEEDCEKSIDSDIADDMNLAGKSVLAYSDEDVPGDDCMVTESESCDSEDDDGADLNDFVVNDDEYESEEESDENENEASSKEARKVKEKKRKRIISKPGNDSDTSESVEKVDEYESKEKDSDSVDSSLIDVEPSGVKQTPRKHKEEQVEDTSEECPSNLIEASVDSRPSESEQDDSQSSRVSFDDLAKTNQTPKKKEPNDSIGTSEKIVGLNESRKASAQKMKHLLPQCSTPKLTPRHDLSLKKSTSAKSEKIAKLKTPTSKPEGSRKSILSASLKEAKTPRAANSLLHTSLPAGDRTILSELKSPRLTALHRTMAETNIDSPEVRFLMKERLNESLPALKLRQRARESRRGISGNVSEEKIYQDEEEENHETIENVAIPVEIVESEFVPSDKKKKKKNKKNKQANKPEVDDTSDHCVEATGGESNVILNESQEAPSEEAVVKKSKKRKKNKKISEAMEIEEPSVHEMEQVPTKKKKKQKQWDEESTIDETIVRDVEDIQKRKKKKKNREAEVEQEIVLEKTVEQKKKKKKEVRIVELGITTSRKKLIPISTEIGSFESQSSEKERSSGGASKKSKAKENSARSEREKKPSNPVSVESTEKSRIKRLPDEVLESLSEITERPQKRRKIVKDEKPLPSRRMLSPRGETLKDVQVNDNFVSLSSSGATTQFGIVDLARATKKSKKSDAVKSFRERMLARNPRQPISAYLMYQQKRKASGKE